MTTANRSESLFKKRNDESQQKSDEQTNKALPRSISLTPTQLESAQAAMAHRGIRYEEGKNRGLTALFRALVEEEAQLRLFALRRLQEELRSTEGASNDS